MIKYIFFAMQVVLFYSCNSENKRETQPAECTLKDKIEKDFYGLRDFKTKQVVKQTIDKNGTPWKTNTDESLRFFYQSNKAELLVYKNSKLYRRYDSIIIEGTKTIPVNKEKCEYDPFLETVRYIYWSKGHGFLEVSMGTNRFFTFWFDSKTSYSGEFDIIY